MFRVRMQLGLTDAHEMAFEDAALRTAGGRDIAIAVLDSGMAEHPDLMDRLLQFRDFSRGDIRRRPHDEYGHGTHVCGILCGDGRMSRGRYRGIFPKGRLVVGKVLDGRGDGSAEEMLEGMEWVYGQRERYGIRILNISVGISQLQDEGKLKALQDMLIRMTKAGITVVCAAGNQGPKAGTLSALGEMPEVISVGCNDGAFFRGDPRRCERYCGRGREKAVPRKPDIVAPGTRIVSCSARSGSASLGYGAYEERSGTSMAAPIVSGCLGRVLCLRRDLSPADLKKILTSTARDLNEPWNKQGWGMIQPRRMERQAMDF